MQQPEERASPQAREVGHHPMEPIAEHWGYRMQILRGYRAPRQELVAARQRQSWQILILAHRRLPKRFRWELRESGYTHNVARSRGYARAERNPRTCNYGQRGCDTKCNRTSVSRRRSTPSQKCRSATMRPIFCPYSSSTIKLHSLSFAIHASASLVAVASSTS